MLNPFFLQGSKSEQGLLQDIINEAIQIHGVDIYYLPRQYLTKRKVIREVIESKFTSAFPLEAYVDTYDGYEGAGTLLSKFGIKPEIDLNLVISRERFSAYITPLIQNIPDIELPTRPKEGDLVWFPLGDRLFEIKFVEHELPFYQLQKTYVYMLRCELFRYQDEIIDTGYEFIDDNTQTQGYTELYKLIGVGTSAVATANLYNGGVRKVIVTNRGDGYKVSPSVGFGSAPTGGSTATGIATMIGGIVDLCEPDERLLRVQGVEITNAGFGYTVAPSVAFYGDSGSGAEAYSIIGNGIVGFVSIINGGSGFSEPPPITVVGIASSSASLRAIVNNGSITEIRIIDGGEGYTIPPQIIIGSPFMVGMGTFIFNEVVTGSITGNSARVKNWNPETRILQVGNVVGNFVTGEILTGTDSQAQYKVEVGISTLTYDQAKEQNITLNPFAQNNDIQIEAGKVIDDTEYNIFGRV